MFGRSWTLAPRNKLQRVPYAIKISAMLQEDSSWLKLNELYSANANWNSLNRIRWRISASPKPAIALQSQFHCFLKDVACDVHYHFGLLTCCTVKYRKQLGTFGALLFSNAVRFHFLMWVYPWCPRVSANLVVLSRETTHLKWSAPFMDRPMINLLQLRQRMTLDGF